MTSRLTVITLLVAASLCLPAVEAAAQSAQLLYARALAKERTLRDGARKPTLRQLRAAVASYEALVRRYPRSGYADNALWQAGNLSLLAFDEFKQPADRKTGLRLLGLLRSQYPSSSLVASAASIVKQREKAAAAPPPPVPAARPTPAAASSNARPPDAAPAPVARAVAIRDVKRTDLPEGVRITLEMDGEAAFHAERIENPRRVFFDLKHATATGALQDATLTYQDDLVREVRFGRHPDATRVVMDMEGAESYSVFTLYEPFRLVVDFKRDASAAPAAPAAAPTSAPEQPVAPVPPPAAPSMNLDGSFSLARQLGLGVARIVIDAGHGGHDPGAKANGLTESELTLDIALRLQRLLLKQPGVDVVMTRATDVFIPLDERTKIANREQADLFLSIHANASRNIRARGVETYFLNFATNPEAEAVAARENAGSGQTMNKLPDILRAIALNNKINESRDFADIVQRSMVRRLSTRNTALRDIGVKQAPFVVLIGAEMPSVLAEMSFVTNKQDAALLKTGAYRQQIAEALLDAVLRYQQSLKKMRSASST
ncbi:MAG: N-acetylmuramoyl-L-alanine amidase, partial [Vicinamibacterales bacterium]